LSRARHQPLAAR